MTEFKVGDKVRVITNSFNTKYTGDEAVVMEVHTGYVLTNFPAFCVDRWYVFRKDQVELIVPEFRSLLPHDSAERKTYPMHTVIAGYFPSALAALAKHSYENNERHNPGEPMHWSRDKSNDHLDAAMRHLVEGDLVGLAWRALAALQLEEEGKGAPVPFAAR